MNLQILKSNFDNLILIYIDSIILTVYYDGNDSYFSKNHKNQY